jgi:hypothetical protein
MTKVLCAPVQNWDPVLRQHVTGWPSCVVGTERNQPTNQPTTRPTICQSFISIHPSIHALALLVIAQLAPLHVPASFGQVNDCVIACDWAEVIIGWTRCPGRRATELAIPRANLAAAKPAAAA